jgi:hypothetical protein
LFICFFGKDGRTKTRKCFENLKEKWTEKRGEKLKEIWSKKYRKWEKWGITKKLTD